MITREALPNYLKAGCKVGIHQDPSRYYKVIRKDGEFKVIPYDLRNSPSVTYGIDAIKKIYDWLTPQRYAGWVLVRAQSLALAGMSGKWVEVSHFNTVRRGSRWVKIDSSDISKWFPVKPDEETNGGYVLVGDPEPSVPTLECPVVEEINRVFTIAKEKTMEDIKLFKPENLVRAKEIAEQERNDLETQQAKAFYETCINKIDAIDRQMKTLTAEKAEWEAKLKPFTEAADTTKKKG